MSGLIVIIMKRSENIKQLSDNSIVWDIIIVGGGATGIGTALDAASRGFKTLLVEQSDFTKATSSRSTKLVHGGVRYLAQGDVGLVIEALHERGLMRKNAPHLVKDQRFIIGNYRWWEKPFYTIGLIMYDILAGKRKFGRSKPISKKDTILNIPQINPNKLRGGVVYHDGQFDDSRMAISLLQTADTYGAVLLNYVEATQLTKNESGKICGIEVHDKIEDKTYKLQTRALINATGIFVDTLIRQDAPEKKNMVRPSQGVHIVVDSSFLGGDSAIMIPKTSDGRVMFGVPWHGKVILGTTDTPMDEFLLEPKALENEIDFILNTAGQYLIKKPTRKDVLSVFAGLRPLTAPKNEAAKAKTKEISRSHKIIVSNSGLITITGGKWTTYRDMAEDVINKAIAVSQLPAKRCITKEIPIHGAKEDVDRSTFSYVYGTDYDKILQLQEEHPEWKGLIHPAYDYTVSEIIWAVREEMALTVEDVLARRLRLLFLDARAAIEAAPKVASVMAKEMGKDTFWEESQVKDFTETGKNYILVP